MTKDALTEAGERQALRPPCELQFREELAALKATDKGKKPEGWKLSPQAVKVFIAGSNEKPLEYEDSGTRCGVVIRRKFYGNDALLDRCIVTLLGNRGLLLVGEPGTAKSMLSELLAAAISGVSTHTTASDGTVVERPSTVMSTAEAVAVGFSAGLEAHYFGDGKMEGAHVARQLLGTVLKDNPEDAKKLRQYFDVVVKSRAKKSRAWQSYWEARKSLDR